MICVFSQRHPTCPNRGVLGKVYLACALVTILLTLAAPQVFAGAPFYLTIEHSYRSHDQPQVRVDFTNRNEPLKLRILKPKKVADFLSKHRLISRAYSEPRIALNPGHYLFQGLGKLQNPIYKLRDLVASSFRKQHLAKLPQPLHSPTTASLAKVPGKFAIAAPQDFTIVEEVYYDLRFDGQKAAQAVPGFEDWWHTDYDHYKEAYLALPKLAPGIYVVQGLQGHDEAQALLQVSNLNVIVKQSSASLMVIASDAHEATPVTALEVTYRDNQGNWHKVGSTGDDGSLFWQQKTPLPGELLVKVADQDHFSLTATQFLGSATNQESLYLFTDRPIFKPGETFHYKGILKPHPDKPSTTIKSVTLMDKDLQVTQGQPTGPLTAMRTFSGTMTLDPHEPPGLYALAVATDQSVYQSELRVQQYKKPTFFMKPLNEGGALRPGSSLRLKLKAERYAGGSAPVARYEVFVYRQAYSEPQWVSEAGDGLSTGSDYSGHTTTAQAQALPELLFSSLDSRDKDATVNSAPGFSGTWATAPSFAADGTAEIVVNLPAEATASAKPWTYRLVVKARDQAGSQALWQRSYHDLPAGLVLQLRPNKRLLMSEEPVMVQVKSLYPDGRPAANIAGDISWARQELEDHKPPLEQAQASNTPTPIPFTTDQQGLAQVMVPLGAGGGKFTIGGKARRADDNPLVVPVMAQEHTIIKPGAAQEALSNNPDLELYPTAEELEPGGATTVVVLLPAGWGAAGTNRGILYETISTDRVLAFRSFAFAGRTLLRKLTAPDTAGSSGFHYSLTLASPSQRWLEKTLRYRIQPAAQLLQMTINTPAQPAEPFTTAPISILVKDSRGMPQAGVEVAVSIVDSAVYAIQPEFRPALLDFFYPLPRLNIQNFYSHLLQGYGYADTIRTPNHSLGALKPRTARALRRARDTAAFYPHLVTNADGVIDIAVPLPENQTIWRVTAIANDSSGRIAEASSTFRSRSRYEVRLAPPRFARDGDILRVPLVINNRTDEATPVSVALAPTNVVLEPQNLAAGNVAPQSELTLYTSITAAGATTAADAANVAITATIGSEAPYQTDYDIPSQPKGVVQHLASEALLGANNLQTPLPQEGVLQKLVVTMSPGAIGLVTRAARYLINYPYGCTEQLASSTTPNLVYLQTVAQPQDGPARASYETAKRHALNGIAQIIDHQHPSGGFRMWSSSAEPSLPATVLAVELLSLAHEASIGSWYDSLNKARTWLKKEWAKTYSKDPRTFDNAAFNYLTVRWAAHSYRLPDLVKTFWQPGVDHYQKLALLEAMQTYSFSEQLIPADQKLRVIADLKDLVTKDLSNGEAVFADYQHLGFPTSHSRLIAAGLGALNRLDALDDATKNAGIRRLASALDRGYWQATFDSGQIIRSLRHIIKKEYATLKDLPQPPTVTIGANPASLSKAWLAGFKAEATNVDLAAATSISFSQLPADYWVSADFEIYTEKPVQTLGEATFAISRQLYILGADDPQPITDGKIPHGATIASVLTIRPTGGTLSNRDLLVVADPLPAFAEPINEDLAHLAPAGFADENTLSYIMETKRFADKVTRVIQWHHGLKELQVAQVWESAFEGQATLPPAEVRLMYDEAQAAFTKPQTLNSL